MNILKAEKIDELTLPSLISNIEYYKNLALVCQGYMTQIDAELKKLEKELEKRNGT